MTMQVGGQRTLAIPPPLAAGAAPLALAALELRRPAACLARLVHGAHEELSADSAATRCRSDVELVEPAGLAAALHGPGEAHHRHAQVAPALARDQHEATAAQQLFHGPRQRGPTHRDLVLA